MGQFSWLAEDSGNSILIYRYVPKHYEGTTTHYMWDNKGNVWIENSYEGYGIFGGKDYYVLLAEMNNTYGPDVDEEIKRLDGISIEFSRKKTYIGKDGKICDYYFPNLTESSSWKWVNIQPQSCENQGCYMGE